MLQAHNYVSSVIRLKGKECKRMPMHLLLKNLVSWQPLSDPAPGYTVVIAAMGALAPLAVANLRLAARQSSTRMRELILVIDRPSDRIPDAIRDAARECSQFMRIRVLGYNRWQDFVARQINWGWVYSWLSWTLAIAHSTTRAVIIHDLDALPIHPRLFESLYDNWLRERAEFCGISQYSGNGVTAEMKLLKTCGLTVDAPYLRQRFRPFDLFNKLRLFEGRVVDFDTMLHVQMQSRRCAHFDDYESQLVHPSGVVCQYTDFVAGRTAFNGTCHNLLMLPYLAYLGGDSSMLGAVGRQVDRDSLRKIRLLGRELHIDAIPPAHWAWMEKQIRRLEHAVFGGTRPEVARYLAGFILRSGEFRTVGREKNLTAVEDF
jgi:hypothetical protein